MALLSEWIKNLIFLMVFAAVMELLLPNNDMKKFVRLLIGLFLVAAILRPVGILMSTEPPSVALSAQAASGQAAAGQAALATSREKRQDLLYRVYCRELEAKIKESLAAIPQLDVQAVKVVLSTASPEHVAKAPPEAAALIKAVYIMARAAEADGQIRITLASDEAGHPLSTALQDKIKAQLYTVYQLPAEKIIFR